MMRERKGRGKEKNLKGLDPRIFPFLYHKFHHVIMFGTD